MAFRIPTKEERASLISNTLGIVGFIILIAVLIWGLFNLVNLAKPWFASVFPSRSASPIQVSAPSANVQSGQPVTISWKNTGKNGGSYSFLYQCQNNFQFKINGNTLPCGAAYSLSSGSTSLSLTPIYLSATSAPPLKVPFTVLFAQKSGSSGAATTSKGKNAQGTGSISVLPTTAMPPSAQLDKKSASAEIPKTTGPADLSVRILSVGVIDPITGNIVPRVPTSPNDLVAVRFDIANVGGVNTGTWYFTAQLPSIPPYTFNSAPQIPLAPGDHIENMLRFKPAQGGTFTVSVDPSNAVPESNESNNFANQQI